MQERQLQGKIPVGKPRPNADILPSERLLQTKRQKRRLNHNLIVAARNDSSAKILRLIRAGADIAAKRRDGWTSLHRAADSGNIQNCIVLVQEYAKSGGDVKELLAAKGKNKETALDVAIEWAHPETEQFLRSTEKLSGSMGKETFNLFMKSFSDCLAA